MSENNGDGALPGPKHHRWQRMGGSQVRVILRMCVMMILKMRHTVL